MAKDPAYFTLLDACPQPEGNAWRRVIAMVAGEKEIE